MTRLLILTLVFLSTCPLSYAREFTKPPSIALRTEISYVNVVKLIAKTHTEKGTWQLEFENLTDIHNTSEKNFSIMVDSKLADTLAVKEQYIIAYHTHRKTKVDGLSTHLPLKGGPRFAQVQGANPAVFRHNELLLEQIKSNPQKDIKNPHKLIEKILNGMQSQDPKVQEFFVRELTNWLDLPAELTTSDAANILMVFNSPNISAGSLIALLEIRPQLHQLLDVNKMAPKISQLLATLPVNLDLDSELPGLIFTALNFFIEYDLGNWDIYSRWILSNNSSITEKALLKLHQLNPNKTVEWVSLKMNNTILSDASRRVLQRYHRKHHSN